MDAYNAKVDVRCFITLRLSTVAANIDEATDKFDAYLAEGERIAGHPLEEQLLAAVRAALHSGAIGSTDEDFVDTSPMWVSNCNDFKEEPFPVVVP